MSVESQPASESVLTDETPARHEFLLPGEHGKRDPFALALELADALAELPETAATFQPVDIVGPIDVRNLDDRILHLLGSWRVPGHYTRNSGKGTKWVNPHYHDKARYSDVGVRCECGALMIRTEKVSGESVINGESDHSEDCHKSWRLHAQARLYERRQEMVRQLMGFGHTVGAIMPRLGLPGTRNIGPVVDDPCFDVDARKDRGRQRIANTAAELLTRYTAAEVGRVYGFGAKAIQQFVNRRTDATADELWEERRTHEREQLLAEYCADVRRVDQRDESPGRLTTTTYDAMGKWAASTLCTQFDGGWTDVLEQAGVGSGGQP